MNIAGIYSFNRGKEIIEARYAAELDEVKQVIVAINSADHRTKTSREKTMPGKTLYNPRSLNRAYREGFKACGWDKKRVMCEYSLEYYLSGFMNNAIAKGAFREMDFVKNRLVG